MYPHVRSLVKKMADKPFALVGVNSDPDLAELRKVLAAEQITWRSFWQGQGGKAGSGPISTEWHIRGWPSLYLLDHQGVIRHKYVGSPGNDKLEEAINKLVVEAEKAKK